MPAHPHPGHEAVQILRGLREAFAEKGEVMLMSKVRIEFSEEKSPGKFNVFANESGTVGENNLGSGLGLRAERHAAAIAGARQSHRRNL